MCFFFSMVPQLWSGPVGRATQTSSTCCCKPAPTSTFREWFVLGNPSPPPPPPPFLFPVRPFRKRLTVCPLRTELLDALAGVDALQRRPCGHEAAGTETKRERAGQRWLHGPDDRLQGRLQRYLHGPDQGWCLRQFAGKPPPNDPPADPVLTPKTLYRRTETATPISSMPPNLGTNPSSIRCWKNTSTSTWQGR